MEKEGGGKEGREKPGKGGMEGRRDGRRERKRDRSREGETCKGGMAGGPGKKRTNMPVVHVKEYQRDRDRCNDPNPSLTCPSAPAFMNIAPPTVPGIPPANSSPPMSANEHSAASWLIG